MRNTSMNKARKIFQLSAVSLAITLAGCGGGDGGGGVDVIAPGVGSGGLVQVTNPSNGVSNVAVGNLYLVPNASGIKLEKGSSIKVSALVLDENNGVISNQPVDFKITNPELTGVFSTSSSSIITDESGKAVIELSVLGSLTQAQKDYLNNTGVTVEATVGNVKKSIDVLGTVGNVDPEQQNVYEVFISSAKSQLRTGSDSTTVDIRVTDKQGGIVAGVPVQIGIKDAAKFGLSLGSSSSQVTDENGLVQVELVQSPVSIDSRLDHESLLTVVVDDGVNTIVEQNMPIYVQGTKVANVTSSKSIVSEGENFEISGTVIDGSSVAIANANVSLFNNGTLVETGVTNNNGEFLFSLNSGGLESSDDGYQFTLEVQGDEVSQKIADIVQVTSVSSSNISFSNTGDVVVNTKKEVVLTLPDATNGDTVSISTNKGKLYDTKTSQLGSSRKIFTIKDNKVVFYIDSSAPGKATLKAEYGDEIKESYLSFVSVAPVKLILQVERSVLSVGASTSVQARVLDKDDAPVKNAIVQFTTTKDASGGGLSSGVAYTDDSGIAKVTYTAGRNPTSSDGVVIEAQVQSLRLPDNTEKAVNTLIDTSALSIQTQSSFISFAFSDKLVAGERDIYYYLKGAVNVLNSAGKPAVNQPVSINLIPYDYDKGYFKVELREFDDGISSLYYDRVWEKVSVNCPGEDVNDNSILDEGEDNNNNNQLDPVNVAAILTDDGKVVSSSEEFNFMTDSSGKVNFQIRYPKEYASWYRSKITVNTGVDGSESRQSRIISYPVLIDDVDISQDLRPNTYSPFGIRLSCENDD